MAEHANDNDRVTFWDNAVPLFLGVFLLAAAIRVALLGFF